jgi:hypothetical protein
MDGYRSQRRDGIAARIALDKRMDSYLARVERQNMRIVENMLSNLTLIGPDAGAELRKLVYG